MLELARSVRFSVTPSAPVEAELEQGRHNTYAGWPSMSGLGAHYELTVRCRGGADAGSGFVMDIGRVDEAVRRVAVRRIGAALRSLAPVDPAAILVEIVTAMQPELDDAIASVAWNLSPYHALRVETVSMNRVQISQCFEFAAAHRLHLASLSDDENRAMFGKCNNPSGHGHNYRLEVVVSRPIGAGDEPVALPLTELERIVSETVLDRFDHAHLNVDTAEFASLNPTVENIARVCFDLLAPPLRAAGGDLREVTVWETEKTSCTYRPDGG